jgi:hypothetical protein
MRQETFTLSQKELQRVGGRFGRRSYVRREADCCRKEGVRLAHGTIWGMLREMHVGYALEWCATAQQAEVKAPAVEAKGENDVPVTKQAGVPLIDWGRLHI